MTTVLVSDLDKTYLDTRFESIRAMLKVPFEKAEEKQNITGAASVMRALHQAMERRGDVNLTFLSASPPLIRKAVTRKFRIDKLPVTSLIMKDLTKILLKGRFSWFKNHAMYKLEHLLQLAHNNPAASFYCLGDDWEYDVLVYCIFRDILGSSQRKVLVPYVFDQIGLGRNHANQVLRWAQDIPVTPGRVAILLHRARYRMIDTIRAAGDQVICFDSYLQLALRLYQENMFDSSETTVLLEELAAQWSDDDAWADLAGATKLGMLRRDKIDQVRALLSNVRPNWVDAVSEEHAPVVRHATDSIVRVGGDTGFGSDEVETVHVDKLDQATRNQYDALVQGLHRKPLF